MINSVILFKILRPRQLTANMIKDTLYIFAGRISNAVFLLLLTLVVSRHLGPALFGVFSFLTTVVITASGFANLGLDTWMVREITKDPKQGRYYLSNVLGLKTGTSLVTVSLVFLIFQSTNLSESTRHLLWVISASVLFNSLSQTLWHYGNCFREFIYHSALWASSNVIKSVLGIVLVLLYQELEPLVWGVVIAEAVTLVISFYVIRRRFGEFVPVFNLLVWKEFFSRSSLIALGMIFSVLYFRLDIVMLQMMTEEKTVGWYSAAYRLFEVTLILPHSFMLVLFPTLVEEYHSDRLSFRENFQKAVGVFSVIGGGIAVSLWFFSEEIIVLIYGEKFTPSVTLLSILSGAIFLFFMNFLLSNVLITSGREKINTWNLIIATILNVLLNLVLIPKYNAEGAAWATVFCEGVLVAAMSLQIRKVVRLGRKD